MLLDWRVETNGRLSFTVDKVGFLQPVRAGLVIPIFEKISGAFTKGHVRKCEPIRAGSMR